ncbi:MAG: hypothetical protein ABJA87_07430 [bacterium]
MTHTGDDRSSRPGGRSGSRPLRPPHDGVDERPGAEAHLARLRAEALDEISGLIAGGQDHKVAERWDDYTREALRALAASA